MIISLIFAVKLAKYLRIMDTVKPARKHRNDDMFGRQGSYISRTHAARTDTIRRPENNGGNYDNQAYLIPLMVAHLVALLVVIRWMQSRR